MTTDAGARPRSAAIVNLGCKVNQSEMEAAARLLREGAVPLVAPDRHADLYLVNTCTVTAVADEKSRAAVRRALRANPDAEVVVTGCSVEVAPGRCAQTLLARAQVILLRPEHERWWILVRPSFAPYLRAWLEDALAF